MALSPELTIDDEIVEEIMPSVTYKMDFENGRITDEVIEGIEAIKQFVLLTLMTMRYAHPIYSSDVGCEIYQLLSDEEVTIDYKIAELPRLIIDALIYDERIESVENFEIVQIGNSLNATFKVISNEGIIEMEEVFLLGNS